jgi:hypothetical protein
MITHNGMIGFAVICKPGIYNAANFFLPRGVMVSLASARPKIFSIVFLALLIISFSYNLGFATISAADTLIRETLRVRKEVIIPLGRESYKPLDYVHRILFHLEDRSRNISSLLGIIGKQDPLGKRLGWDLAIPLKDRKLIIIRTEILENKCYIYYILYNDYTDEVERSYVYQADPVLCSYDYGYGGIERFHRSGLSYVVLNNYTVALITRMPAFIGVVEPSWNNNSDFKKYFNERSVFVVLRVGDENPSARVIIPGYLWDAYGTRSGTASENIYYSSQLGYSAISVALLSPHIWTESYWYGSYYVDMVSNARVDLSGARRHAGVGLFRVYDSLDIKIDLFRLVREDTQEFRGKVVRTSDGGYLLVGGGDGDSSRCRFYAAKINSSMGLEWLRNYYVNLTTYYEDLMDIASKTWGNNSEAYRRANGSYQEILKLPPSARAKLCGSFLFEEGIVQRTLIPADVNLPHVSEVRGSNGSILGYLIGTKLGGTPYGGGGYYYGYATFMLDPRGNVVWNVLLSNAAGGQAYYLERLGSDLTVMGITGATAYGPYGQFGLINLSSGVFTSPWYDPAVWNSIDFRAAASMILWGYGRAVETEDGDGYLYTDLGAWEFSYIFSGHGLEIGYARKNDLLAIFSNVKSLSFKKWVLSEEIPESVANISIRSYTPLVVGEDGVTIPNTSYKITLSNPNILKIKHLGGGFKLESIFRYPQYLMPGYGRFGSLPTGASIDTGDATFSIGSGPSGASSLFLTTVDLGSVKVGDEITYKIEGIKLTKLGRPLSEKILSGGFRDIQYSSEGFTILGGNLSKAGYKERFILEVKLKPNIPGPRAYTVRLPAENLYPPNNPREESPVTVLYGYRILFMGQVTNYVAITNHSSYNISIKYAVSTAITSPPPTARVGVPTPYNFYITNIGNIEAVFIYAFLMPFYIRAQSVLGADLYLIPREVEDGDMVALAAIKIPPGGMRTIQVIAVAPSNYIYEFNPQGSWKGFSISIRGAGFANGYNPLPVQVATLSPDLWNNLTKKHRNNIPALFNESIEIGLDLEEKFFDDLIDRWWSNGSEASKIVKDLAMLEDSGTFGKKLAEAITSKFYRKQIWSYVEDFKRNGRPGGFYTSPLDIAHEETVYRYNKMLDKNPELLTTSRGSKLPINIEMIVEVSQSYSFMQLLSKAVSPKYSYIPVAIENTPQSASLQTPQQGAGSSSTIQHLSLGSAFKSLSSIALQSQGQGSTVIGYMDAMTKNCLDLYAMFGIKAALLSPEEIRKLNEALKNLPIYKDPDALARYLVDKILSAIFSKRAKLVEKYGTADPSLILQMALERLKTNPNDPVARDMVNEAIDLLKSTSLENQLYYLLKGTPIFVQATAQGLDEAAKTPLMGLLTGILSSALDTVLVSYLDNSGVSAVLARYGIYVGGSEYAYKGDPGVILYNMASIGIALYDLGSFAKSLPEDLVKAGTMYTASTKGIAVQFGKLADELDLSNTRILSVNEISINSLEDSLIKILSQRKWGEGSEDILKSIFSEAAATSQLKDLKKVGDKKVVSKNGYEIFEQSLKKAKGNIIIDVRSSGGVESAGGFTITLSRQAGDTPTISIVSSSSVAKTVEINGDTIKLSDITIYKSILPGPKKQIIPYAYSQSADTFFISAEEVKNYVKYIKSSDPSYDNVKRLINKLGENGMTAISQYLDFLRKEGKVDNYAIEALKFYGFYKKLLSLDQSMISPELLKAFRDKYGDKGWEEVFQNLMKEGNFKEILDWGSRLGLSPDKISVKTLSDKDIGNLVKTLTSGNDLGSIDALDSAELAKKAYETQSSLDQLGSSLEALTNNPLLSGGDVNAYISLLKAAANYRGKTLEDCAKHKQVGKEGDTVNLRIGDNIYTLKITRDPDKTPMRSSSVRIIASIDPNQVSVTPDRFIRLPGQELGILAEFENYANASAEAVNVTVNLVIKGPIDPKSVEVVDVSRRDAYISWSMNTSSGSIVYRILFENINLPPNKKPPEGQGWVLFKAKTLDNIKTGDTIEIYADIVFDYNPPLRTNIVNLLADLEPPRTTLKNAVVDGRTLTIEAQCTDTGSGCHETLITLRNTRGLERNFATNTSTGSIGLAIDLSDIEPGSYTITIVSKDVAGNVESKNTPDTTITIQKQEAITTTTIATETIIPAPTITIATTQTTKPEDGKPSIDIMPVIIAIILVAVGIAIYMVKRKRVG